MKIKMTILLALLQAAAKIPASLFVNQQIAVVKQYFAAEMQQSVAEMLQSVAVPAASPD